MPLKDLRQLERDDIDRRAAVERAEEKALRALEKAQRKAARRAAWEARWPRWTAWWEARGKELKIAATVVGSVLAITAGVPRIVAPVGRFVGHAAKRAWSFYADRDVGKPAQPKPTGAPTTALDFPKTAGRPGPPVESPTTKDPR